MEKRVNKKKIVSMCPSKMVRSKCPSIRRTRQIRRELLMKQRDPNISEDILNELRKKLRKKKASGISVDCKTCIYNPSRSATITQ